MDTDKGQKAREFAAKINSVSRAPVAAGVVGPAEVTVPDLADQIRKLAELRDAGILTAEEFNATKTDLAVGGEAGRRGTQAARDGDRGRHSSAAR